METGKEVQVQLYTLNWALVGGSVGSTSPWLIYPAERAPVAQNVGWVSEPVRKLLVSRQYCDPWPVEVINGYLAPTFSDCADLQKHYHPEGMWGSE
jgi:hypothetical protein